MHTIREHDLVIAALTIYGEARGESDKGQIAVAYTIINRARARRWWGRTASEPDHSLAAVCLRPWQYSPWNKDDPNRPMLDRFVEEPDLRAANGDYRRAMRNLLNALDGVYSDPTDGACHFLTERLFNSARAPAWARDSAEDDQVLIGAHRFIRGVT